MYSLPHFEDEGLEEQLQKVKSYLFQLIRELNAQPKSTVSTETLLKEALVKEQKLTPEKANQTFQAIKAFIIQSADIVNAYAEQISTRLSGAYTAQNDFAQFREYTEALLSATSQAVTQQFSHLETLSSQLSQLEVGQLRVNAWIRTGEIDTDQAGRPVYGVLVGQETREDGNIVFHQYARFTSDRLSFYDQADREVAFISDRSLYITDAVFSGSLKIGGWKLIPRANGNLSLKKVTE